MFSAGVRFNPHVHVIFDLDTDDGTMTVALTLIDNDGVEHIITGDVVWDD